MASVERAPRDVPAGVDELPLERLGRCEREVAVASTVAHEHPQSATAAVERPPGGGRDSRPGEQNEPSEGPRRAESKVAGEHGALRETPEHERARRSFALQIVEERVEVRARRVEPLGHEERQVARACGDRCCPRARVDGPPRSASQTRGCQVDQSFRKGEPGGHRQRARERRQVVRGAHESVQKDEARRTGTRRRVHAAPTVPASDPDAIACCMIPRAPARIQPCERLSPEEPGSLAQALRRRDRRAPLLQRRGRTPGRLSVSEMQQCGMRLKAEHPERPLLNFLVHFSHARPHQVGRPGARDRPEHWVGHDRLELSANGLRVRCSTN